jgi:ABC-type enterobactin transport system permease subunit
MHLFAFILIGGIWAAFLLPSVLDGRRSAPLSSTRNFARSQDLLASVATTDARHAMKRRRNSVRRRRVLTSLGAGAALSLVGAIVAGSTLLLAVSIGFDLAFAGYVTLLLSSQQVTPPRAPVVPLRVVEQPHEVAPATVRVIAG